MEIENKKICIFIDGGNFHHLVIKKLGISELDFDFEKFAKFLAENGILSENSKRYYIGTVREIEGDESSKKTMSKQTRLFSEFKKDNWLLRTSKLKNRLETIEVDSRMVKHKEIKSLGISKIEFHRKREKGIDVMMATDIIVGAVEDKYDIAIVVSSDADLLPAIKWVRENKDKKIIYIGFSMYIDESNNVKPLSSMIQNSDMQRVMVESDLLNFKKNVEEK